MTNSLIYQRTYNEFGDIAHPCQQIIIPHSSFEKHTNKEYSSRSRHRLSLSALLQKKSLVGRRISIFARQQQHQLPNISTKQSLKIMIPECTAATMKQQANRSPSVNTNNDGLDRMHKNSSATTASICQTATSGSDEEDEDLKTPSTNSTISSSSSVTRRSSLAPITTKELQSFITESPTCSNHKPLKDFSGKGYSNFYIKLPNGNWMVRVRDGNRNIVGTFEVDGCMV